VSEPTPTYMRDRSLSIGDWTLRLLPIGRIWYLFVIHRPSMAASNAVTVSAHASPSELATIAHYGGRYQVLRALERAAAK